MEPVDRTSKDILGLVDELDTKLAHIRHAPMDPVVIPDDEPWVQRVPTWLGMVVVLILGVGLATVVVRPWQERCSYDRAFCAVAELDIDALRVTVPHSALIAALPSIDALDPNDELTAGDIFRMERFEDIDFDELLTDEEVERLLELHNGR